MKRCSLLLCLAAFTAGCGNQSSETAVVKTAPQASEPAAVTASQSLEDYQKQLTTADELIAKKQINEAVQILTQAISLSPQRKEAFIKRAAICADASLLGQAIIDMTSAIALDPENPKFLNTRGYFLLLSKQYERADADFSDAIGLDLQYPQPYNNRGLIGVAQGKYESAIKDFDNALQAKPDYVDAHNNRGFALLQSERYEEAVEAFSNALKTDPKYLNAITNRARAQMKLRHFDEAIKDLTQAIELQPDFIQHYLTRSEAYALSDNQQAAADDLEHVGWLQALSELNQRLARNARDADGWAQRGRHLLKEHRNKEARTSFENALSITPDHVQALVGRAEMAVEEKHYEAAIQDCTAALKKEYSYEVHSLRGDAYFALQKFGEAIADYDAARRFDERVVQAYRQRAEQLRKNGDPELAKADENMAQSMQKRLTDAMTVQSAAPRAVVIEQASYEEPASAPVKAADLPSDDNAAK